MCLMGRWGKNTKIEISGYCLSIFCTPGLWGNVRMRCGSPAGPIGPGESALLSSAIWSVPLHPNSCGVVGTSWLLHAAVKPGKPAALPWAFPCRRAPALARCRSRRSIRSIHGRLEVPLPQQSWLQCQILCTPGRA